MKKSKVMIIGIIIVLILEICLYYVAGTYSRYTSSATSSSTARTAKWTIKIGNIDIAGGENDFSSELELDTTNSAKVARGTIAPSTSVQGSFVIDPNGTEVAMKYTISLGEITFKNAETNEVVTENTPQIRVSNVSINTGVLTKIDDNTYKGNIDLEGESVEVTIQAEWISLDNSLDTINGYTPLIVTIPVNVTVEQDT